MKKAIIILICAFIMTSLVSCKSEDTSDIPADIEVSHHASASDRILYENLKQVEKEATIIVEAVAKNIIDQKVSTSYDAVLEKTLPASGLTMRECEISKVHKGEVELGETIILLQDYYIWDYSDDSSAKEEALITTSYLKPAAKGNKYIMFLAYDGRHDGYWPVSDYQGMFSIPKKEANRQSDIDVYDYVDTLAYLNNIYEEVAEKYFISD